ncbi:MAG: acyltransferase family protein [Acutalibacteraceae bacterium]
MKFSKEDTLAIKGIAILMMVHFHGFSTANSFKNFDISFFPFSETTAILISNSFKVCVGMFALLSGYGLAISLKKYINTDGTLVKKGYSNYLYPRLFKLMSGYWFIFILAQTACAIITQSQAEIYFSDGIVRGIYKIILDFFGVSYLFGVEPLNDNWWYMGLAIFIIVIVPFIVYLVKRFNSLLPVVLVMFVPRIIFLGQDFSVGEKNNPMRWLLAVVLGVIFAEYDVFARAKSFMIGKNKIISKLLKFIISTATLLLMFYARISFNPKPVRDYTYEFNDNILPAFLIYYLYDFITDIPVLRQILMFLGKHSMNMFLIHTFIRLTFLKAFVYSFRHFILVTLVVVVISLVLSIIIELLKKVCGYNKLIEKIQNKIYDSFCTEKAQA